MDTVLIVDDSVMIINYLEESFKKYKDKFDLVTANNGLEAIAILKKKPISLLVTDLQMPKIDGLGLLAYRNKYHAGIPCIVISAHGTPTIIETLQSDILKFIEKPFTAEELAQAIISALKRNFSNGSLSGISISNFLQMIEMEEKTCLCEIDSPNNPKGFLYFKGGVLYQAVYGDLKGEEAAFKIIAMDEAEIRFKNVPKKKIAKRINTELTSLIMEAMRRKGESDG